MDKGINWELKVVERQTKHQDMKLERYRKVLQNIDYNEEKKFRVELSDEEESEDHVDQRAF